MRALHYYVSEFARVPVGTLRGCPPGSGPDRVYVGQNDAVVIARNDLPYRLDPSQVVVALVRHVIVGTGKRAGYVTLSAEVLCTLDGRPLEYDLQHLAWPVRPGDPEPVVTRATVKTLRYDDTQRKGNR